MDSPFWWLEDTFRNIFRCRRSHFLCLWTWTTSGRDFRMVYLRLRGTFWQGRGQCESGNCQRLTPSRRLSIRSEEPLPKKIKAETIDDTSPEGLPPSRPLKDLISTNEVGSKMKVPVQPVTCVLVMHELTKQKAFFPHQFFNAVQSSCFSLLFRSSHSAIVTGRA